MKMELDLPFIYKRLCQCSSPEEFDELACETLRTIGLWRLNSYLTKAQSDFVVALASLLVPKRYKNPFKKVISGSNVIIEGTECLGLINFAETLSSHGRHLYGLVILYAISYLAKEIQFSEKEFDFSGYLKQVASPIESKIALQRVVKGYSDPKWRIPITGSEGNLGMVGILAPWIILLKHDIRHHEIFKRDVFKGPSDIVSISKNQYIETIIHEIYHFWQSISCSFLYKLSLYYFDIMRTIKEYLSISEDKDLIKAPIKISLPKLNLYVSPKTKIDNINWVYLVEGMATYQETRFVLQYSNQAHDLEDYLDKKYPDPEYKEAYEFTSKIIGKQRAFNYFPAICFYSLCTNDPVDSFSKILNISNYLEPVVKMKDAVKNIRGLIKNKLSLKYETALSCSNQYRSHPILVNYLNQIEKQFPEDHEFPFIFPVDYSNETVLAKFFMPPLIFHSHGLVKMALGIEIDTAKTLALSAAMIGASRIMIYPELSESFVLACPYKNCPYWGLKVCNKYYYFPHDWHECDFPDLFEEIFKWKLNNVFENYLT